MKKEVQFQDTTYYISKPSAEDEAQARLQQSKVFNKALEGGACLKSQLNKILKQRKIWDENDDKEVKELSEKIEANVAKLDEGGFEIMEARKLAIETNDLRMKLINKMSILREHNTFTAEGQADDAYFDTLVSLCCYNEDGEKIFKSYEDYLNHATEERSQFLAKELSGIIYGNLDYIKDFPENKFLIEFGFVNDNLEYIDENGDKVNENYESVQPEEKKVRKPFLKNGQPLE